MSPLLAVLILNLLVWSEFFVFNTCYTSVIFGTYLFWNRIGIPLTSLLVGYLYSLCASNQSVETTPDRSEIDVFYRDSERLTLPAFQFDGVFLAEAA